MNLINPSIPIESSVFETVLEISSDVIWISDFSDGGGCQWITSEKKRKKYGIPNEITSFDFWVKNIHPRDRKRSVKALQKAFENPDQNYFEQTYLFLGSESKYFLIHDKMKFQRDPKGRVRKVTGVWRDISHTDIQFKEYKNSNKKKIGIASETSEKEFILNELQPLAQIGCWEYRVENNSMYLSNEMYAIHDLEPPFKIRDIKDVCDLYDPESAQLLTEKFSRIHQQEFLPIDITVCLNHPLKKWLRITAYPFYENGNLKRIVGLTYDITQFKEAESKLKWSEEKFYKIFQNDSDLTTLFRESDTLLVDVNKNVFDVLGYTREELVGKIARDIDLYVDPSDLVRFAEDYYADGFAQIETSWKRKDNRIIRVQITSNRIEINGENYAVNKIKDITAEVVATEKFRKAFDLSPVLMIIIREHDRTLVDVSAKLEEILGYEYGSFIGKTTFEFDFWHNIEDRERLYSQIKLLGTVEMETLLRRKTGNIFHASIHTDRIQISGENHLLVLINDITEKKLAESKLKESEARLDAIINNTDLNIWSVDRDFRITVLNNAFKQTLKEKFGFGFVFDDEEHRGKEERKNIPEPILIHWNNLYKRAIEGEIVEEDIEITGNYYHTSLHPIIENENIIGASIYARDITERKRAKEKLLLSEANLTATVNNTNLLVFSLDRDFNLIMFNEPFRRAAKARGLELDLGKRIVRADDLDPEHIELKLRWEDRYRKALSGEYIKVIENLFGRIFECSLNQIIEHDKITGISVFIADITERVKQEEELAKANKKIGELKLMALRSIMNPHFIFNALNSIQYFILRKDRLNAINYLSTFSKLIRCILNNTIENKIKLSEEVEQLKYYINLEKLRFEDRFDFVFNINESLNLESVELPSLLIQPFVENAILHGLSNKEGKGVLKVSICREAGFVLFEIEDNGVGRNAATEFKSDFSLHKSIGFALTEERLKLINADNEVSIEIIDLMENDNPSGTKVKIWVKE